MIQTVQKPTKEQLIAAVAKVKEDHGLKSTAITHTDHGAGLVRHYLSLDHPQFAPIPLDEIRILCVNLSRAGDEPGKRAKSKTQRADAILPRFTSTLAAAYPRASEHSREYDEIHGSEEYRALRDRLKKAIDYRCQSCSLVFQGHELQGHIVDYRLWREPGMILILCAECHEIIDALRRRGVAKAAGEDVLPIFALDTNSAAR